MKNQISLEDFVILAAFLWAEKEYLSFFFLANWVQFTQ